MDNTYISECLKNHCNRWFIHFSWRGLLNSTWFSSSMSMFKMASLLGRDNIFRRLFLYAMHFSWDRRTALIVLCSSLGFFFNYRFLAVFITWNSKSLWSTPCWSACPDRSYRSRRLFQCRYPLNLALVSSSSGNPWTKLREGARLISSSDNGFHLLYSHRIMSGNGEMNLFLLSKSPSIHIHCLSIN